MILDRTLALEDKLLLLKHDIPNSQVVPRCQECVRHPGRRTVTLPEAKLWPHRAGLRLRGAKELGGVCFYYETLICVMQLFCNTGKGWQRRGTTEWPAA